MLLLTDRETEGLRKILSVIETESRKETQTRNRVTNSVLRAQLILKKASRRHSNTLELF